MLHPAPLSDYASLIRPRDSEGSSLSVITGTHRGRVKALSLSERVAAKQAVSKGRCDPSQIQPLSLWERVAEGRVRAPNNPAAPIHCR